jgi:hypothetical protein
MKDNYLGYYLPQCPNRIDTPSHIEKIEYTDRTEFLTVLREILSHDCRAFVVDSELLWNEYIVGLNYRQKLYQSMTRDYVIANPYSLINMFEPHELHILDIYMYGQNTTLYKILAMNDTYTFTFYN